MLAERKRQDAKWGEQNHELPLYLTILMEEVGEMSQAYLDATFGAKDTAEHVREEAVQVAAVALAIVECLDRKAVASVQEIDAECAACISVGIDFTPTCNGNPCPHWSVMKHD
jgi:NTP pyrophosphatase (non-canonical NTP hydrolase)